MDNLHKLVDSCFEFPTSWRHGRGIAAKVGDIVREINGQSVLVLTDNILYSRGMITPIIQSLEDQNLAVQINSTINQEPSISLFDALVSSLDMTSFDTILAIGGGSVLDTAKGVSVIASFGGHIRDYDGFNKIPGKPSVKMIAVPTTSGTGSEISDGVVLIDEERQTKFIVISKKICPDIALTDPELTVSMPPSVTAHSGVDALVHAIESYISRKATPTTEIFALKAIELISGSLVNAFNNGSDLDARERTQMGATMAMIAGMNSYLGLCHAMAMPLCALYHMPHGIACGMMLPIALEYNLDIEKQKIKHVYQIMGFWEDTMNESDSFRDANQKLTDWLERLGVSSGISRYGYEESHNAPLIEGTLNSAQRSTSPRQPTKADLMDIIQALI